MDSPNHSASDSGINKTSYLPKKVFNRLLQDFRPDTPEFIKDLFMDCVHFERALRPAFNEVC